MGKYDPWDTFFRDLEGDEQRFTFEELETLAQVELPPSAHTYAEWWSRTHYHAIWDRHGWKASPRIAEGAVVFRRRPAGQMSPSKGSVDAVELSLDADAVLVGCVATKRTSVMVGRIQQQWERQIRRHDGYVARPQSSGYRGHHIVANRDGRLIEIQVRTENQHTWAESVESISRAVGQELKWGVGPTEILDYYVLLGGVVDVVDRRMDIPEEALLRVNAAQELAKRHILEIVRGGRSNG